MPSAKDRAKATGDTHLPEIEPDEVQTRKPHPAGAGPGSRIRASRRSDELIDQDAPPMGDSGSPMRESAQK
jgi:hypothetical protein